MQTDNILRMGGSHWICQDYVISGTRPVPHVLLADGCSASPGTDVGARLLVHSARAILLEAGGAAGWKWAEGTGTRIIRRAESAAERLGLQPAALDATLMALWLENDQVRVRAFGDGHVLTVDREGRLTVHDIACDGNAAPYLSYRLDPERARRYADGGFLTRIDGNAVPPGAPVRFDFSVDDICLAAVASDGLGSFIDRAGERIPASEVAVALTRFKTTAGAFLKRRTRRAVRDLARDGVAHYDDLSIGAMLTGGNCVSGRKGGPS